MTSLTDEMKADGWVEHDGGPCPVPATSIVTVYLRREQRLTGLAIELRWDHGPRALDGTGGDILGYKLVKAGIGRIAPKPEQDHANG